MKPIFLLFLCLACLPNWASAERSFNKELDYLISESAIEDGFSGNILVKKGKWVLYQKSVGFSNLEHDVPMKPETKFMIASVSKQFTAALILKLQDENKLKVTDLVSKYVSTDKNNSLPDYWGEITLHDLLTHTSGAQKDVTQTGVSHKSARNFLGTLIGAIFYTPHQFSESQVLGEDFSYSNLGYVLLAGVVEKVCRKSFEKCLSEKLLDPLGLENTGIHHQLKILKNQADGYYHSDNNDQLFRRCCIDSTNLIGSHSMYSDVIDLTRWNQFIHSGDESTILSLKARSSLVSASIDDLKKLRPSGTSYGYGYFIDQQNGLHRIWHDGSTSGFLSLVSYLPEKDISIVILNNYHGLLLGLEDYYNMGLHDKISQLIKETYR